MSDDSQLFERTRAVWAKYGGLQQSEPCECHHCRVAEPGEPPILVPYGSERDEHDEVQPVGRWLHGLELKAHLRAQREFLERFNQMPRIYGERRDRTGGVAR